MTTESTHDSETFTESAKWSDGWKPLLIGLCVSLCSVVLVSWVLRGHEIQGIGAIFIAFPISLLLIIIGTVLGYIETRRRYVPTSLTFGMIGLGFGLFFHVPACLYPYQYWTDQLKEAEAYCESLVPFLDEYYARNGRYPKSIDELKEVPPAPPAFIKYASYDFDEERGTFHFWCHEPGNLLEFYSYYSEDRSWQYSDF